MNTLQPTLKHLRQSLHSQSAQQSSSSFSGRLAGFG